MAISIEQGFVQFDSYLADSSAETEQAREHLAAVLNCLRRGFDITRLFRVGSCENGTSILGCSDVEYFATIPTKRLKEDSDATVRAVYNTLAACFPDVGVALRTPAVLVPLGADSSEWIEIMPAHLLDKDTASYIVYRIADGSGGWMVSSPDAHGALISTADRKLGGRVRPLIRFIKAWKYFNSVSVSSFYLETRVANYVSQEVTIVYPVDVRGVLRALCNDELAGAQDPTGITGYIQATTSEGRKSEAMSKLQLAVERAEKASEAESVGDITEAFHCWNEVFAGRFPSEG